MAAVVARLEHDTIEWWGGTKIPGLNLECWSRGKMREEVRDKRRKKCRGKGLGKNAGKMQGSTSIMYLLCFMDPGYLQHGTWQVDIGSNAFFTS